MRIKPSTMENDSDLHSYDDSLRVIEIIPDIPVSSKRIPAPKASSSTSTTPSTESTPTSPNPQRRFPKESPQHSKLGRILSWIKSHAHQTLSLPSGATNTPSSEHIPKSQIKQQHLSHQTAFLLHSMTHPSMLSYNQPLPIASNQLQLTDNAPTDEQLQHNHLPCRQHIAHRGSKGRPPAHPRKLSQPAKRLETLLRKLSDAFRRRDVERDRKSTLIMHENDDGEILDVTEYNERNKDMRCSPSDKSVSRSSSTALTENFEDTRAHDTLSSSSSDLDQVERDEDWTAVPRELKRTYTSSEDSYRGVEIETLSSATVDEVSITTYSSSDDSTVTSSTSALYTVSEECHTAYELSVTIPELDGTECEAASVSSGDADVAWREIFIAPLPAIVGRTYSSSSSECEESWESLDEAVVNRLREAVTGKFGQGSWSCEEVSEILSNQGPSRSQRGYIQCDPTWLEETKEERGGDGIETVEWVPKVGTASQPMRDAEDVDERCVKPKKAHMLKKAARLLSKMFGRRSSRSPHRDGAETHTRTRRKSVSSLFWRR